MNAVVAEADFGLSSDTATPTMLPLNASQIPRLFNEARAEEAAGRPLEAERIYRDIVAIDARHAPAQFQLGQIAFARGDVAEAAARLERAADLAPTQPPVWKLYAQVLARLGDQDKAATFVTRAKKAKVDPRLIIAFQDAMRNTRSGSRTGIGSAPPDQVRRAIAALQAGDAAGARRMAAALRRSHPDVALFADLLANALAASGRPDEAEAHFADAVRLDPDYAEARANYGRFLVERGRTEAAIAQLKAALKIAPRMANAWASLGVAHARSAGAKPAAEAAFGKALAIDPDHRLALIEFARFLMMQRRSLEAAEMAARAEAAGADPVDSGLIRARALSDAGQGAEALAQIDAVLERRPGFGPAFAARAAVLQTLGRFDEAHAVFREAIAAMPTHGETYRILTLSQKLPPGDPLIDEMKDRIEDPALRDIDRAHIGFALAKALEDTGRHDEVFTYLRPANDLVRKLYPYDVGERRKLVDEIRTAYGGADFRSRQVEGASDFAPIFVTGLPRSGTTLVEQILASHSRVSGGGELSHAREELDRAMRGQDGRLLPLGEVTDAALSAAAEATEARMRAAVPGADLITDKSVQSYVFAGPIRLALPRARIVVVRRDPRDNLLSIYKNMFADDTHRYSYSLADLAVYYRLFEDLVAFWHEVCPGWVHEIRYEDLIDAPEREARALIAACDLPWEDGCLKFHENRRRVDTLSVHQVRQPIYRSSVKGWERYADELGDLLDGLKAEGVL